VTSDKRAASSRDDVTDHTRGRHDTELGDSTSRHGLESLERAGMTGRLLDPERLTGYAPYLLRIARLLTRSADGAEDLVQDTFERVLRKPRLVAGGERAYLDRALRNTHRERLRAAASRITTGPVPDGLEFRDPRDEDHPITAAYARDILDAVAKLPEIYRVAVVAVDLQGESYDEVAQRLGVPCGTVQSRAFRGRARVARTVGDDSLHGDRLPVY
jgi:RNA polymerase sigma-70 factor (ECF subfamily)